MIPVTKSSKETASVEAEDDASVDDDIDADDTNPMIPKNSKKVLLIIV